MIVRLWRGWAEPADADAYPSHFRRNVLPELGAISGFLGASLFQSENDGEIEFLVMTRWASLAAIKAFAGDDYENAVVEPEAVAALVRFERTVLHYEDITP